MQFIECLAHCEELEYDEIKKAPAAMKEYKLLKEEVHPNLVGHKFFNKIQKDYKVSSI